MTKPSLLLFAALLMVGCGRDALPIASPIAPGPVPAPVSSFSVSGVVAGLDGDGCPWPVRGAHIRVVLADSTAFEAVTGDNGLYAIRGIPAALCDDSVEITVESGGYQQVKRSLRLTGDAVVNFELAPRG